MAKIVGSRVPRLVARLAALTGCVLALSYCGEQGRFGPGPVGPGGDTENPVVTVTLPSGSADTVTVDITDSLKFTVRVTDNATVSTITVRVLSLGTFTLDTTVLDTTITAVTTDVTPSFTLVLPANSAGQRLSIAATAADATGNTATRTVIVVVEDPQPPVITVREPSSGVTVPAGGTLTVIAKATDPSRIGQMGARIFSRNALGQPVTIAGDSQTYAGASLVTAKTDTFQVVVPFSLRPGQYPLHVFAADSSSGANDTTSADITISVADTLRPFGSFLVPVTNAAIAAGDSVLLTFIARDSTGVQSVAFRGISTRGNVSLGTDTTVLRFDAKSTTFASLPRDTTISRYLNAVLSDSTVEPVFLEATITDIGGNTAIVRDTIQITGGAFVRVSAPSADTTIQSGTTATITITGFDPRNLTYLGFQATGAVTRSDSLAVSPAATNAVRGVALPVPTSAAGIVQFVPFARNASGTRFVGTAINVFVGDTVRPTITVLGPTLDSNVSAGDSVLLRVRVQDNRGVSSLGLAGTAERGDSALGTNQSVTRYNPKSVALPALPTDTTLTRYLLPVLTDSTVEPVYLSIAATDAAGNTQRTLRRIQIDAGPFVGIARPVTGDTVPVNSQYDVIVTGFDPDSLRYLGLQVSGRVTTADSVEIIRAETRRSQAVPVSFPLLVRQPLGTVTLVPFAIDRLGNRFTGRAVVVTLKDLLPPYVEIQKPDSNGIDTISSGAPAIVRVRVQDDRSVNTVTMFARDSLGALAYFAQRVTVLPRAWPYGLCGVGGIPEGCPPGFTGTPLDTAIVVAGILTDTLPATTAVAAGRAWIIVAAIDSTGNTGWDSVRVFVAAPAAPIVDAIAPVVTISQPAVAGLPVTVGDSVLVRFQVTDGRGVDSVVVSSVARRGVDSLGTGADVQRFASKDFRLPLTTDTTLSRYLLAVATDSSSEIVQIIVTAFDAAGNRGADTATVRIVSGPVMTISRPTNGSVSSVGKSVTIEVRASDPNGVRIIGWRASGVLSAQDSAIRPSVSGNLADTTTFIDTLTIPGGTPLGSLTIVPFGVDSLGDPSGTVAGVTVDVQSAAGDVTPPTVSFAVAARVEVDDSIFVTGTDASGLKRVGWIVRALGSSAVVRRDSTVPDLTGNLSDVTRGFQLNLDSISTFPRQVTVEAFAVDSVDNRATSAAETLTVVAGKTIALPLGGQIGDAIYNRNRNELYLSNTTLNRLEIFQLNDSTFAPGIPVGSRPVGLALMPSDTLGNHFDSVIVANSGGTNLSIVAVNASRVEARRHRLPNYLIQTVKTSSNAGGGGLDIIVTEFDLSDRPLYVGATCRAGALTACDSVLAVYSTTPTPAQPAPFTNRGYMAWENLRALAGAPSGHFFYEVGTASSAAGTDTLQIIAVRDTAPGLARRDTILGAGVGTIAALTQLAFQESTLVRNSGDFNHVLVGEGGLDQGFARALTFDARAGAVAVTSATCPPAPPLNVLKCTGVFDRGVSEGVFLRDFLVNRASRVLSIATNFNGRTNLVRADSIYAFDFTLRQTGIMEVGGANAGMDFPRENTFDAATRGTGGFGGSLNPNDRVLFAARPDANIDVFDTFFYGRVTTIPIRDPIVGPIRVATNPITGQRILVGVTANGIVTVRLPSISNIFPAPPPLRAATGSR